ncbi:MAG: IS982 family transposase [Pyrinomonadaceae bacterium]
MTEIYCFVDDFLRTRPRLLHWRRSPHARPHFTDAEVLSIALLQGIFGVATLKQTYRLVAHNWRTAFPRLPSYAQWLHRLHLLGAHITELLASTCGHDARQARLYLVDSKPIPLCHSLRHGRVRLLREDGARFGKTSKGWFFGFKLHALRHIGGRVMNLVLTPANEDDRPAATVLANGIDGGVAIGDLGYRGERCATALRDECETLLITRDAAPQYKFLLSQVRQGIETMFSQWWHRFIDRVFSRSWRGLWNTLKLKVLHYNLVHAGVLPNS